MYLRHYVYFQTAVLTRADPTFRSFRFFKLVGVFSGGSSLMLLIVWVHVPGYIGECMVNNSGGVGFHLSS